MPNHCESQRSRTSNNDDPNDEVAVVHQLVVGVDLFHLFVPCAGGPPTPERHTELQPEESNPGEVQRNHAHEVDAETTETGGTEVHDDPESRLKYDEDTREEQVEPPSTLHLPI